MFKFLKEKLSSVVKQFSKDVEEDAETIKPEEKKEIPQKQKETHPEKPKKNQEDKKAEKKEAAHNNKKEKNSAAPPQAKNGKSSTEKKQPKQRSEKAELKEEKSEKQEAKSEEKNSPKLSKSQEEHPQALQKHEEKKGFFSKIFRKDKHDDSENKELPKQIAKQTEEKIIEDAEEKFEEEAEETEEEKIEQEIEEDDSKKKIAGIEKEKESAETEKKGFFKKVGETFTKIHLSEERFEELFWELEIMLLENNVAVEVISKIKEDLKAELMSDKISRRNVEEIIRDSLRKSLEEILDIKSFDIEERIKSKKPYIIAVIGVNGSGKTTAIAKLTKLLQKKGHSVVLAAADTFRAAAIQQLEHHADALGVKMIKHDYNSDPAAVAFDAIKHANAKQIDVVIIDTAGRLHSNDNLMNELKKLIKVNSPDLKIFVGESITGNDCVEQAKVYDEIIGIDGIILSKADIDEKGGAALSISYVTKKPVLFMGTGQTYDDLKPFDKNEVMEGLGF